MKFVLLLLCTFGVCFLFLTPKESEIRVRVISNSDSKDDIFYKENVVNYLKNEIFPYIDLTDKYFKENYKSIEEQLNIEFDNVVVEYEKHNFKNKAYNGNALENGTFNTLLIYIGSGQGSNWWGSIFEGTLKRESSDVVEYKWYFNN